MMLLSNCTVCGNKSSRFIKEQEASGLLGSLGIKISILSKLPIVGNTFFKGIKWIKW